MDAIGKALVERKARAALVNAYEDRMRNLGLGHPHCGSRLFRKLASALPRGLK